MQPCLEARQNRTHQEVVEQAEEVSVVGDRPRQVLLRPLELPPLAFPYRRVHRDVEIFEPRDLRARAATVGRRLRRLEPAHDIHVAPAENVDHRAVEVVLRGGVRQDVLVAQPLREEGRVRGRTTTANHGSSLDVHEPDIPSGYGKREHVTRARGVVRRARRGLRRTLRRPRHWMKAFHSTPFPMIHSILFESNTGLEGFLSGVKSYFSCALRANHRVSGHNHSQLNVTYF